jgi:hypothetical protein
MARTMAMMPRLARASSFSVMLDVHKLVVREVTVGYAV